MAWQDVEEVSMRKLFDRRQGRCTVGLVTKDKSFDAGSRPSAG